MARSKGFQGIVGRKKASTWGTAVAAGSGDGVRVLSLVPDAATDALDDRAITGRVTMTKQYTGNRNVKVTMVTNLRYEGNTRDLAQVFGVAGVPSTVDTTGKKHVGKIADQIDGIFNTLAFEFLKDTKVAELPTVKWTKATIRGEIGGEMELQLEGIGFDYTEGSATNTTTTIDTITVPANNEIALFKHLVMRLNAQGGGALGSGDVRHISKIEIVIERMQKPVFSSEFGDKTAQPIESDFMKVTGSFTFPETKDTSPGGGQGLMSEQMTLTRYKMDINITSPNLAGSATSFFAWVFYLPDIQLQMQKGQITGPEGPEQQVNFEAHSVLAIPTGFPAGYVDAIDYENVNQDGSDALA